MLKIKRISPFRACRLLPYRLRIEFECGLVVTDVSVDTVQTLRRFQAYMLESHGVFFRSEEKRPWSDVIAAHLAEPRTEPVVFSHK